MKRYSVVIFNVFNKSVQLLTRFNLCENRISAYYVRGVGVVTVKSAGKDLWSISINFLAVCLLPYRDYLMPSYRANTVTPLVNFSQGTRYYSFC